MLLEVLLQLPDVVVLFRVREEERVREEVAEHLNQWESVPLAERIQQVELERGEAAERFPFRHFTFEKQKKQPSWALSGGSYLPLQYCSTPGETGTEGDNQDFVTSFDLS